MAGPSFLGVPALAVAACLSVPPRGGKGRKPWHRKPSAVHTRGWSHPQSRKEQNIVHTRRKRFSQDQRGERKSDVPIRELCVESRRT